MSALGQKQTCAVQKGMSALPPKADSCSALAHVRFGPKADSCNAARGVNSAGKNEVSSRLMPRASLVFYADRIHAIDTAHDLQQNKFRMPRGAFQRLREPLGLGEVSGTPMEINHALILCRLVRLGHRSAQHFRFEHFKPSSLPQPDNH